MPPPVRIESKAWDDPRFAVMGRRLGIDRDLALIRMARVWAYQTEEGVELVEAEVVDALFGIDGAAAAAVRAALAEEIEPGLLRMKGTSDPGRIDWRNHLRRVAQMGGRARAASAQRDPSGRMVSRPLGDWLDDKQPELPGVVQPGPAAPPALSSAPSPSPSPSLKKRSSSEQQSDHLDRNRAHELGGPVAEKLRSLLVANQPRHQLSNEVKWRRIRPGWARTMGAIVKDRGEREAVELLDWVFGDQDGSDCRFRVDSPKALAEKWDRIEARMRAPPRRGSGRAAPKQPKLDEVWGRTAAAAASGPKETG